LRFVVCFLYAMIQVLTLHTTILICFAWWKYKCVICGFCCFRVVFLDSLACSEKVYETLEDHEFSSWGSEWNLGFYGQDLLGLWIVVIVVLFSLRQEPKLHVVHSASLECLVQFRCHWSSRKFLGGEIPQVALGLALLFCTVAVSWISRGIVQHMITLLSHYLLGAGHVKWYSSSLKWCVLEENEGHWT